MVVWGLLLLPLMAGRSLLDSKGEVPSGMFASLRRVSNMIDPGLAGMIIPSDCRIDPPRRCGQLEIQVSVSRAYDSSFR